MRGLRLVNVMCSLDRDEREAWFRCCTRSQRYACGMRSVRHGRLSVLSLSDECSLVSFVNDQSSVPFFLFTTLSLPL